MAWRTMMRGALAVLAGLFLSLGSAPPCGAVPAPSPDPADLEAWFDGFLPYALDEARIPGAVVVVVRSSGPIFQKGYGLADMARGTAVDAERTLFRVGSVSKLLTWTAVMQQVEAGRLDLDRDVNAYLDFTIPAFQGQPITLRQLMTHSAGFEESIRDLSGHDRTRLKPLGRLLRQSLPARVFPPGTTPAYSNYGAALAGYIVERVSGTAFDDYVERRILAPLDMRRASFRQPLPSALAPLLASGYPISGGPAEPFEYLYVAPAGALSASGADIGRFMSAHLNRGGPLLRPETARAMHDFRSPGIGPINRMALGFYEQRANGHRVLSHAGDTSSFHSQLWLFPDADLGLFIALNGTGRERAAGPLRHAVFHRFADRYLPGADPQGQVDAATARRHGRALAGRYMSSRSGFTSFVGLGRLIGQVTVTADETGKIALPALDWLSATPRDWVEIAPWVWMDLNTGERLAAEVRDGRVVAFGFDPVPPVRWLRAPAGIDAAWLLPALGAALLLIAVAALAWPARALIRRHYRAPAPFSGRSLASYRLTRLLSWICVAAATGWMVLAALFLTDPDSRGGALDWLLNGLRALTPLATLGLASASAWHLALCHREKRRWTAKASALLLLTGALVLIWVTLSFRLYGFGTVY